MACVTDEILHTSGPDGLFNEEVTGIHSCVSMLSLVGIGYKSQVSESNSKKNHLDVHP